ncbi:MAG: PqqD family protein [Bacteroidales bacterium]|nr:PqqD family protein [Bacteroidales bacterium]
MKLKPKLAISDSGFIFDPSTGESYSLNEEGLIIVQFLKEGKNEEEIKEHFLNEYDIDETTFSRSYLDFISMLKHFNLIEHE